MKPAPTNYEHGAILDANNVSPSLAYQIEPFIFTQNGHPRVSRLGELRAGAGAGHHVIRLFRNRAGDLGAQTLGHGLGFVARHLLQRAGEDDGLPGNRRIGRRPLSVDDVSHLRGEPLDNFPVMALAEIRCDSVDHRVADLIDIVHLRLGLDIARSDGERGSVKCLP